MEDEQAISRQQLLARITELESLVEAMRGEKNAQELLNFPWIGNLGAWYWYFKTNRVICNDQKILALGYSKEEIPQDIGFEYFTEKLHPDDFEKVMENMRAHLYGRSAAYEATYRIRTKHGAWAWFYDRGKVTKRGEDGRPEIISGIVFDVTEQKRMEERLEEQNRRLVELSTTDFLTGLLNRRALYDKLDYEIRRNARSQKPLSVLLLDIDHFKRINDTYGHLAGDRVLAQTARLIRSMLRSTDLLGRYGGEEFLAVLPDCTLQGACGVAEKIRQAVEDCEFEGGIRATISGGVLQYGKQSLDVLVDSVDRLLYAAKNNGRNRIELPGLAG